MSRFVRSDRSPDLAAALLVCPTHPALESFILFFPHLLPTLLLAGLAFVTLGSYSQLLSLTGQALCFKRMLQARLDFLEGTAGCSQPVTSWHESSYWPPSKQDRKGLDF